MNEAFGGNGGILGLPEEPVDEPQNDPRATIYPRIPWPLMPLPNLFGLSPTIPSVPPASSPASSSGSGDGGNSYWGQSIANAPFGANTELPAPASQPNYAWDTSIPSWWHSAMPFGTNVGEPATSAQPIGESWGDRWAGRQGVTARPSGVARKELCRSSQRELGESAKRPVMVRIGEGGV